MNNSEMISAGVTSIQAQLHWKCHCCFKAPDWMVSGRLPAFSLDVDHRSLLDLNPEPILNAAGFQLKCFSCFGLTVFCRALFSPCMPPDTINLLFHIYSGFWTASWGCNGFENRAFTLQAHAQLTVPLYWAFLVYLMCALCFLESKAVYNENKTTAVVRCNVMQWEENVGVFLLTGMTWDGKFDDTCFSVGTVLCILNSVIQLWLFSVDSFVDSSKEDEYLLLSRVSITLFTNRAMQKIRMFFFPHPHNPPVLQIKTVLPNWVLPLDGHVTLLLTHKHTH